MGHSKLDELLLDEELMEKKRAIASTKPKKTSIGPSCPICDVRDPAREHVARHFGDELNEVVNALQNKQQCMCKSDYPRKIRKSKQKRNRKSKKYLD